MAVKIKRQGFTIVELLFTIVIVSILTGAGIMGYRQQTKKAFATEVETQLSAASKKLITTALGLQKITESNCPLRLIGTTPPAHATLTTFSVMGPTSIDPRINPAIQHIHRKVQQHQQQPGELSQTQETSPASPQPRLGRLLVCSHLDSS